MGPLANVGGTRTRSWGPVVIAVAAFVLAIAVLIISAGLSEAGRNRFIVALLITTAFALAAYGMQAVTRTGALAGALVSFSLYASAGLGAFLAVVTVFLLASITTRMGYARKQRLGKAESRAGRSAAQVLANLSIAAVLATMAAVMPMAAGRFRFIWYHDVLLIAAAAALAEAAADTVSSECGEAWSDHAWLITTWEPVPPGTDGGISAPGTVAGAAAAFIVAVVCAATQVVSLSALPIAASAAILGMFFDSLLGATLERRHIMGNNTVNFASTAFAALVALVIASVFR